MKYLFTTSTCPNCKIAKQMLAEAEEEYQLIDAEKNPELVSRYGIMQAPTPVSYTHLISIKSLEFIPQDIWEKIPLTG